MRRKGIPGPLVAVLVLLGLSVFINYIDRGSLSIAAPMLKDELHLGASQLGILLSAFFWTYACLQPFAGWIVDRWNVNWVFAAGFFLWSAATAVTGTVHVFVALLVLRLLLGVGESIAFPSYSKIIALNYSEDHRGLANSIVSAGLVLGPGFGMLFGGMLMGRVGWRPFFLVLGLASLLWLIPWIALMPKGRVTERRGNTGAPSLLEFIGLRSAWGSCLGLFATNYVSYFLITWLPFYLVRERGFSMDDMAKTGGVAYLLSAICGVLAGWISDRWIASGASPTLVRKTFTAGGIAAAGLFVGLAAFTEIRYSVIAITLGLIFFGMSISSLWAITQTLAGPLAAGRWTGFQNFVGNLAGVAAPAITGFVLDRTGHFHWAFAITTGIALAGSACWVFLVGRIEQVQWGAGTKAQAA